MLELFDIEKQSIVLINKKDISVVKFDIKNINDLKLYKFINEQYKSIFGFDFYTKCHIPVFKENKTKIYYVNFLLKNNYNLDVIIGKVDDWVYSEEECKKQLDILDNKFKEIKELIKDK